MIEESRAGRKLRDLKRRLKQENPILEHVVDSFQDLDRISRRLGFLDRRESYANRTSWWPLISVLGVYSSGKSSFINHFLGCRLQATGNQAVDDKFTVICFTDDKTVRVLPGLALDADPRFPFYRISQAIDEVAQGEGRRIDAYLQLKTCASEQLRGRILIDSPGFDADAQRTSTLRITDHIIDLSDLVLVFFDARHPEIGSMHDTLEHLVRRTISRRDTHKFIFILNQIDATLKEDNTEEVFASWQRALAQSGLTTGCFYAVCIPELAIVYRIEHVSVERAYRIVGILEQSAHMLANEVVPRLQQFLARWRRLTLLVDGAAFGALLLAFLAGTVQGGYWDGLTLRIPLWEKLSAYPVFQRVLLGAAAAVAVYIHFAIRRWAAERIARGLSADLNARDAQPNYLRAFRKNSRWFRSIFRHHPAGGGRRTERSLAKALEAAQEYVQQLNNLYTNPSGEVSASPPVTNQVDRPKVEIMKKY
jgi:hypothetical protein